MDRRVTLLERALVEDREWKRQTDRRLATLMRMILANQREIKDLREESKRDWAEIKDLREESRREWAELKEQRAVLTSIARALNRHLESGER